MPSEVEAAKFRDAALLLQGVVERQQRALSLQAEATRELGEAITEQSKVVSMLLVGDPNELLQGGGGTGQ